MRKGKISRSTRLAVSNDIAIKPKRLIAGRMGILAAAVAGLVGGSHSSYAANTADPVLAGATDLGTNTTATYTTVTTTTSDVEFLSSTTYTSPLGLSAALSIGTLDDFNTSALAVNGAGLLTLNTAANSVAPNAADLLYVAATGNLTFNTSGGITFTPTGNVDDAGTLSLGTSPVNIAAGTTLSFIGAGATTIGGNIAATTGAVSVNNSGGSVTFSGTNAYTGATNLYNGALLSADVTSSLGNGGAVNINPGATLRTLSTSGGSLGGGAIALNNGTIQAGDGSLAAITATLPGVLTFTGASTINLKDNGSSTAALTLNGATPGLVRNANNAATLILNGATALNGTTDTLTVTNYAAGGNATVAGVLTNGILPSYEVGTAAGSTDANFLTAGTSPANGSTIAGLAIKAYSGYTVKAAGAAQTFTNTVVYDLGTGASTITSGQNAYGIKFDSGATLNITGQTLGIGGGNSGLGGIIFNGTGDSITGGTFQGNGNNGEVDIYTANSATISSNFTSGSGGGAFTFFGPGTLTLSGATVTSTNGSGVIAVNGNVTDNLTTGFVMPTGAPFIVNNGTLTLNSTHNNNLNGTAGVTLTVNALGNVDLAGSSQTIYRLAGGSGLTALGGTITSSAAGSVLTLNNQNGGNNDTYYGNITSANLSFAKLGNNTETLSGLENYGGTTTVKAGQLTFAPVVAGVNDSLGVLSFNQGVGTVQSNYQGSGTTTLTFSNLTARTAGAAGNFTTSGGTNGTNNSIVLTQINGATPASVAKTLLDPGYFFGGSAYATVDSGGFLRAYVATDTNGVNATGTNPITTATPLANVFLTGSVSGQTTANVNTLNLGASQSLGLATNATFGTNGIIGSGLGNVTGGSLTTATTGGELVAHWNGSNQLVINSPIVNNGTGASSFTDAGGSIYLNSSNNTYTGVTTVDGGTLYFGGDTTGNSTATGGLGTSSGVVLNSGGNLSFYLSNPTTFAGSITTGTLESGSTITQAGTGTVTLGNITNTGNTSTLSITRSATGKVGGVTTPTGAFTLGTLNGNINLTDNSTVGSTAPTTFTQTGTGLSINTISSNANGAVITLNGAGSTTIGVINGASGGTVNLSGTGTTTVTGSVSTVGEVVNFNSGSVSLTNSGSFQSSLHFNGATVTTTSGSQNFNALVSLTATAGTFTDSSAFGLRMGGAFGAVGQGTGNSFSGTQNGGSIIVTSGGNNNSFELGSNSNGFTDTYALSGGILTAPQVDIGNGTGGTGTSSFTLSGTGKLLASTTIQGGQGSGAIQNFIFNGGTLAANTVDFTKLTTSGATTGSPSTFMNAGGTLAPGDIGTAGRTSITGNYSVTSSSASLAIDLGGTNSAGTFQTTLASASYDNLVISGTGTLGGTLNLSLLGTFVPTAANSFTIVTDSTAGGLTTAQPFTNIAGYSVASGTGTGTVSTSSGAQFTLTDNGTTIVLNGFTAPSIEWTGSTSNSWDTTTTNNWQFFGGGATQFANGDSVTFDNVGIAQNNIVLPASVSAGSVTFNNTSGTYTISGPGTFTGTSLSVTGSGGTAVLAAAETITGATSISSGATLQLGNGGTAGSIGTTSAIADNGTLAFNRSNAVAQGTDFSAAAITGTGSVVQAGAGTLTLSAANTFSGGLLLKAGTVNAITSVGALGGSAGTGLGTVTVGTGAVVGLNGDSRTFANPIAFADTTSAGAQLTLGTSATNAAPTFSGNMSGAGNVVINDAGTGNLTLSGALGQTGTVTNSGVGANKVTLSGVLGSTVSQVVQSGASSTLFVDVANTATQGTTTFQVNSGTLNYDAGTAGNRFLTGSITLNAGVSQTATLTNNSSNGPNSTTPLLYDGGQNTIYVTGAGTNIVTTGNGNDDFEGPVVITEGDSLIVDPTTNDGRQFWDFATTANQGATVNSITSQGSGSTASVLTLENNTTAGNCFLQVGTVNIVGSIVNSATHAQANPAPTVIAGIGANVIAITQNSIVNNNLLINGSNTTSTETVTANTGTIQAGTATAFNAANVVTVNGAASGLAGTFDVNNFNQTIAGLNGATATVNGTVTNSGAAVRTLTLGGSGSYSYGGTITATTPANLALAVTLTGSGKQVLSGSNTYSGGTTLNSGTLVVSNTAGSATGTGSVTLNGGTLASGANGTISGAVMAGTGAYTIAPGGLASVGNLNLGSTLQLNGSSTLNLDVIGANSDLLNITGTLGVTGTPNLTFASSGTLAGTYTVADFASTAGLTNSSFSVTNLPTGYMLQVDPTDIKLVPTPTGPAMLTWNNTPDGINTPGNGTTWDAAMLNWHNGATLSKFSNNSNTSNGDNVTFNDSNNARYNVVVTAAGVTPNTITLASSQTYNFSGGSIGGGGGLTVSSGIVNVANTTQNAWGNTTVNGGTLNLNTAQALPINGSLTIASTATVAAGLHGSSSPITVLQVSSLSNSGTVDVGNNDLVIHNASSAAAATAYTTAYNQIQAAYANAAWTGTSSSGGIITSTQAQADVVAGNYLTAVGVASGLSFANYEKSGLTLATTDVVVKYTYYGDANLDGMVDGSDYTLIDAAYNQDQTDLAAGHAASMTGWQNGDFNYDGVVDGSDYTLIDNAFNTQGSSLGATPAALIATSSAQIAGATAQLAGGTSAVPEPTTLGLVGIGAIGLLGRRRRK